MKGEIGGTVKMSKAERRTYLLGTYLMCSALSAAEQTKSQVVLLSMPFTQC
jgi:hypothetical protein